MHRTITTCFAAVPFIQAIETEIQAPRWTIQGYDSDCLLSKEVALCTYYGLIERGGGGIRVELNTLSDPSDTSPGEDLRVVFSFAKDGDTVSYINFVLCFATEKWAVNYEEAAAIVSLNGKDDPAQPLAAELGINLNGDDREISDTQTALALIHQAANFAFEHCNG